MLWAISIAALLSTQITVGHVIGNPKSTSTLRTKTSSLHAYDAAAYSASAEDNATTFSCFEAKLIGAPMK